MNIGQDHFNVSELLLWKSIIDTTNAVVYRRVRSNMYIKCKRFLFSEERKKVVKRTLHI